MGKIAIMTDSNSGITQEQARELGVYVLPMPFYIDGEVFLEDISLSQEQFYEKLSQGADVTTSQPSPGEIMDKWNELLESHDELVYIPMSSGLSGTCQTSMMLAEDYDGRVQVVDNQRISITQRQSVLDAKAYAGQGKSAAEIKEILEGVKMESSIYITLSTLKYLKKGGRITPAAAAIGTMLKLNPVLQIQGEKLDAYAKCRGKQAAKKTMIAAIQKDLDTRFAEAYAQGRVHLAAAYTDNPEEAREWEAEIKEAFPCARTDFVINPLSLSVSCHIGEGALAIGVSVHSPGLD